MINKIENALKPLGLPIFEFYFDSSKKYKDGDGKDIVINEYITYAVISETPSTYADDVDEYTEYLIDVNHFTKDKKNANKYKLQIRDALRNAGYIIDDTNLQYENDTRYYHTTISVIEVKNTEKYTEE